MQLLDLTLNSPAENLALDEAMLLRAENWLGDQCTVNIDDPPANDPEVLRIWEAPAPFVVLGSSSQREIEANLPACQSDSVPVLRRASGGAAIVTGPGCLMYAVVLSVQLRPELREIEACHGWVLDRLVAAINRHLPNTEVADENHVARAGTSDLVHNGRKFSGNSLRIKRHSVLYHGTLLYDFVLEHIAKYLGTPPRQPEYRAGRAHHEFVGNLPLDRATLVRAVTEAFDARQPLSDWPHDEVRQLEDEKYSREEWNARL